MDLLDFDTLLWAVPVGLAVLGGGGYLAYCLWKPKKGPEFIYRYTCERCKQRIRYRQHQLGRKAMCPNCFQPFNYPAEAVPEIPRRDRGK